MKKERMEEINSEATAKDASSDAGEIPHAPGGDTIDVTWNGEARSIARGASLEDVLTHAQGKEETPVIVAQVNHKLVELYFIPSEGDVIRTYDIGTAEGNRSYLRGLQHILVRACKEVLPGAKLIIEHKVGKGLYCEIEGREPLTPFDVDKIGRVMRQYVERDEPFVRMMISRDQAIELYNGDGQTDKARLLRFRENKEFKVYRCGDCIDYFYGHVPPSTGYLQRFRLEYETPGFVLLYPQRGDPDAELNFDPPRKLMHVFRESERWARILDCSTVADLNEMAESGSLDEFVLINEARHDQEIVRFAQEIRALGKRVVLVAGPSSSGKTTFTQKLRLQLRVSGKKPIMISLDNYYIDRDAIPRKEDGTLDLEDINTLNLPLFNEQMKNLLAGHEVELPRFNFQTGKSESDTGRFLRLGENDVLLIEGIHGLNDMLTESIPRNEKFKIYISALTQLNLDNHNRISTTDVRLIRRLVRDYQFRGAAAELTFEMWPSVGAGENKWIFPFQERCDVMFNSTLVYELLFLAKYAKPLLEAIPCDSPYHLEANRINKFLNYFTVRNDESIIPNTSLLREFIGGGVFEH